VHQRGGLLTVMLDAGAATGDGQRGDDIGSRHRYVFRAETLARIGVSLITNSAGQTLTVGAAFGTNESEVALTTAAQIAGCFT
jgi:hypothetical protein